MGRDIVAETLDLALEPDCGVLTLVDGPHLCAGIVFRNGVAVRAAPILGWALGKTHDEVAAYCRRCGWHVVDR